MKSLQGECVISYWEVWAKFYKKIYLKQTVYIMCYDMIAVMI